MKKVLLLCASHNDLGLIFNLRKLGFYIIVTGKIPGLVGEKYADKYFPLDYSDKEAILNLCIQEKVDAICQCCNDFGVYTAAYVAEKLHLPGYDSYETTLTLHNKDKFKAFTKKHHLMSVESFSFSDYDSAYQHCLKAAYPLIVKPTDASAGNGISKVNEAGEVDRALREAFQKTRSGTIVIEKFLTGSQHGFCTFLVNKKVVACCGNNEYSFLNPYRVEIDTWPATSSPEIQNILIDQIEEIARILDLKDGIFHLQYILSEGKPYILEVMRRVLGNMYGVPAKMVSNFDWDYWECRAKTGMPCTTAPIALSPEGFFAYKTILAPQNGTIHSIDIPKRLDRYVWNSFMLKKEGETVTHYQSEPLGFLFLTFASQREMLDVLIDHYEIDFVQMQ